MFMMPFPAVQEMHPERYRKQPKKHRWIFTIGIAIILILMATLVFAQAPVKINPTSLSWDKVVDNGLAGYRLHWGNEATIYTGKLSLNLDTFTDKDNPVYDIDYTSIKDGHYYYVVTAYDKAGNESGYSNEVNFIIDKSSPDNVKNLRLIGGITITINVGK